MAPRFLLSLMLCCILLIVVVFILIPASSLSIPIVDYSPSHQTLHHTTSHTTARTSSTPNFRDSTLDWGVMLSHKQTTQQLSTLNETLGSGICIIDVNNDNWMDIFFIGGSGHTRSYGRKSWWHNEAGNRLLLNNQGNGFTDITKSAGLEHNSQGMGCAVADLDNNGWHDLIITGIEKNLIYKNTGSGHFIDVTPSSGVSNEPWSTHASIGDFNNDGLTDIYISNYVRLKKGHKTFERNKGFVTQNVAFDTTLYDPLPNRLYENQGNFVFRDVTKEMGVSNTLGRSLGAHWVDLNNDQWLDLIVINDLASKNQVYINHQGKHFSSSSDNYALLESPGNHSALIDDFNNDGINDILFTKGDRTPPILAVKSNFIHTKYKDQALATHLASQNNLNKVNWGSVSGDFNNDSNTDVFIASGTSNPDIDSSFVPQGQYNQFFEGTNTGHFISTSFSENKHYPLSSRAAIKADLNNDGLLELIITNNNNPIQIFQNTNTSLNHWLGFDFHSENTLSEIYGAKIKIHTDQITINTSIQTRQGFLSQSDPRIHVGLGQYKKVNAVTINWPDGMQSTFNNLIPGFYYSINKQQQTAKTIKTIPPNTNNATSYNKNNATLYNKNYDKQSQTKLAELLLHIDSQESFKQFTALWKNSSSAIKQKLLAILLLNKWQPKYLFFVKDAITSPHIPLNLLAIDILKSKELEYGIYWLIPLLQNPSDKVKCATANTLQFYFEEEEAVIHRKNLSISPLIRMLEQSSPISAICAANALAAAEKKRSTSSLIHTTQKSTDSDLQSATVHALGLIRERTAKPLLIDIISHPDHYSPHVISQALIALKRINTPNISIYFDKIFNTQTPHLIDNEITKIQILNELFSNDDSIVFDKKKLLDYLYQLLDMHLIAQDSSPIPAYLQTIASTQTLSYQPLSSIDRLLLEILRAIKLSKSKKYLFFAKTLTSNHNVDIKTQAYSTTIALNTDNPHSTLHFLFQNESNKILLTVIKKIPNASLKLNKNTISSLSLKIHNEDLLQKYLQNIITKLNHSSASKVLSRLYTLMPSMNQRESLISLCHDNNSWVTNSSVLDDFKTSSKLHYDHVSCLYSSKKQKPWNNTEALQARVQLKQIINSSEYTNNQKYNIVIQAAKVDSIIASTMLLKSLNRCPNDYLADAIKTLGKHNLSHQISPFLWHVLKNSKNPLPARFESAKQLLSLKNKQVLDYLKDEQLIYVTS